MGLDMYANFTTETIKQPVDFKVGSATQIHCWRKHPDLHGWMQHLYYDKGGQQDFNCVPVVLDLDDLDRLELTMKAGSLPQTQGFFFGTSDGTELDDDFDFLDKARRAIAEGYTVFYQAWW
ncbi:hypothetical protein K227x_58960 [Rubripirellula lacrimiformis]|uniref:Uncharacterized protein n=1 Tax=Rubripirellula lacrimiformis TaxID=1930273 RepID=A0A517NK68_9BACT|nr:phosphoglycerate kinase [Rubripirellula lacrimiformis]QDT07469.1 hypothetical protein K227x_58960 [Rubripirellula lacrimiformis]